MRASKSIFGWSALILGHLAYPIVMAGLCVVEVTDVPLAILALPMETLLAPAVAGYIIICGAVLAFPKMQLGGVVVTEESTAATTLHET